MAKDYSTTIHTFLCKATKDASSGSYSFEKLTPIVDFPDMGGTPDTVDITDLDDDVTKNLNGVQSINTLEFLANYDKNVYESLLEISEGKEVSTYALLFGKSGKRGVWVWDGELAVWVVGGGVNAARQMRVSISTASKVEYLNATKLEGATFGEDITETVA